MAASKRGAFRCRLPQLCLFMTAALVVFSVTYTFVPLRRFSRSFKTCHPFRNDALFSRYHVPWDRVPKRSLPNLMESRGNVLYSSLSLKASDGLGHALATFNAEVFVAFNLGLAYSHRVAEFGSLTKNDSFAVERFFGLGDGELSRHSLQNVVCDIPSKKLDANRYGKRDKRICPVCTLLRTSLGGKPILNDIIQLPKVTCGPSGNARGLRQMYSRVTSTLFTMDTTDCDKLPALSDFSITGPIFYWKYWNRHGVTRYGEPLRKEKDRMMHELRNISYDDKELSISIHVRRGDFLDPKNRRTPTPSRVFVALVTEILHIIRSYGDRFASLRPAVHIFCEGVKKEKRSEGSVGAHDISDYDPVYVDVDGTRQSSEWWQEQFFPTTLNARRGAPFPLPRVIMHIAQPTLPSLHEMASADVFIGSSSGLSRNIIRSIGRGTMLLPCECFSAAS